MGFGQSEELQDVIFDHRRSQSVPIVELPGGPGGPPSVSSGMEYLPTSMLAQSDGGRKGVIITSQSSEVVTSTTSTTSNGGGQNQPGANDDLDLTLSALKDCDKDFSKFVQEVENSDGGSSASGGSRGGASK